MWLAAQAAVATNELPDPNYAHTFFIYFTGTTRSAVSNWIARVTGKDQSTKRITAK